MLVVSVIKTDFNNYDWYGQKLNEKFAKSEDNLNLY
jgi:hypothetical protein